MEGEGAQGGKREMKPRFGSKAVSALSSISEKKQYAAQDHNMNIKTTPENTGQMAGQNRNLGERWPPNATSVLIPGNTHAMTLKEPEVNIWNFSTSTQYNRPLLEKMDAWGGLNYDYMNGEGK